MDTYVPSEPLPGILGGKSGDGELDGIQAWKKGMKDKEKQDREKASADQTANGKSNESQAPTAGAQQLDEIQLFRLSSRGPSLAYHRDLDGLDMSVSRVSRGRNPVSVASWPYSGLLEELVYPLASTSTKSTNDLNVEVPVITTRSTRHAETLRSAQALARIY